MTRPIRKFTEMLGLLSRGRFEERLDDELAAAIESLEQQPNDQGTAKINVEITLKFQNGRLDVKPNVKSKLPEGQGFTETPFWTHEGALSVQHPSQLDMLAPRDTGGETTTARRA
jgi:hypothetical protein